MQQKPVGVFQVVEVAFPQSLPHPLEAASLHLHESLVLPGGGQVGVDSLHPYPQGLHRQEGIPGLLPGKTHPVHPRVHLEVGPGGQAQGPGPTRQGLGCLEGGEGGQQVKAQHLLRLQGMEASQQEDLPLHPAFPQGPSLAHRGHRHPPGPLLEEEAGQG